MFILKLDFPISDFARKSVEKGKPIFFHSLLSQIDWKEKKDIFR